MTCCKDSVTLKDVESQPVLRKYHRNINKTRKTSILNHKMERHQNQHGTVANRKSALGCWRKYQQVIYSSKLRVPDHHWSCPSGETPSSSLPNRLQSLQSLCQGGTMEANGRTSLTKTDDTIPGLQHQQPNVALWYRGWLGPQMKALTQLNYFTIFKGTSKAFRTLTWTNLQRNLLVHVKQKKIKRSQQPGYIHRCPPLQQQADKRGMSSLVVEMAMPTCDLWCIFQYKLQYTTAASHFPVVVLLTGLLKPFEAFCSFPLKR